MIDLKQLHLIARMYSTPRAALHSWPGKRWAHVRSLESLWHSWLKQLMHTWAAHRGRITCQKREFTAEMVPSEVQDSGNNSLLQQCWSLAWFYRAWPTNKLLCVFSMLVSTLLTPAKACSSFQINNHRSKASLRHTAGVHPRVKILSFFE